MSYLSKIKLISGVALTFFMYTNCCYAYQNRNFGLSIADNITVYNPLRVGQDGVLVAKVERKSVSMSTDTLKKLATKNLVATADVAVGIVRDQTDNFTTIMAHVSYVGHFSTDTQVLTLSIGDTHVTSTIELPDGSKERCQVYDNGACNCHGATTWDLCSNQKFQVIRNVFQGNAIEARNKAVGAMLYAVAH